MNVGFNGCVVNPHKGFSVSHHCIPSATLSGTPKRYTRTMILCGKFVFAITIAPSFLRAATIAASESAGAKARPT